MGFSPNVSTAMAHYGPDRDARPGGVRELYYYKLDSAREFMP